MGIRKNFTIKKTGVIREGKLKRLLGYKIQKCNLNKEVLIKHIDKGHPLIVGVDTYYLEFRKDSYEKKHALHYILVYGYDLENQQVNVVEHDYENSYDYEEKCMSLDNLLSSNKKLGLYVKKKRYSCRILSRRKKRKDFFSIWNCFDGKRLSRNKKNSAKNLMELKKLFCGDIMSLQKKSKRIAEYLHKLKKMYFTILGSKRISQDDKKVEDVSTLINAYSNILAVFFKMSAQNNFEYAKKYKDRIIEKIETIDKLENIVYSYIWGECNEPIFQGGFTATLQS